MNYLRVVRYIFSERLRFLADLRLNLLYLLKKDKSQFGESILIQKNLKNNFTKYYLEIGCFQPILYSNSYDLGENFIGMHFDANPRLKLQWKIFRNSEYFINMAVSAEKNIDSNYYLFHRRHAVLNTFDIDYANHWLKQGYKYKIKKVNMLSVLEIINLFRKVYGADINFLMIDAEGLDYEIIFKFIEICTTKTLGEVPFPKWILAEDHDGKIENLLVSLTGRYRILEKKGPSSFFELSDTF
jgi:hypothetical protein